MASRSKTRTVLLAIAMVCAVSPWLARQMAQDLAGNSLFVADAIAKNGNGGGKSGGGNGGGKGNGGSKRGNGDGSANGGSSDGGKGGDSDDGGRGDGKDSGKGTKSNDDSDDKSDGDKSAKDKAKKDKEKSEDDSPIKQTTTKISTDKAVAVAPTTAELANIKAKMLADNAVKPASGGGGKSGGQQTFSHGEVLAVDLNAEATGDRQMTWASRSNTPPATMQASSALPA